MGSFGVYLGPKSKSSRFLHVLSGRARRGKPLTRRAHPAASRPRRPLTPLHAPRPTRVAHGVSKSKTKPNASTRVGDEQLHNNSCLPALPPPRPPHLAAPAPAPTPRARAALEATNPATSSAPVPAAGRRCKHPLSLPAQPMRCLQRRRPAASFFFFEFFWGRRAVLGGTVPARSAGHSRETSIR